ncbi:hydroxymethylglutaryl-CoA synthase [Aerococcaceae bacterium NML191292]|nr:hydroxymethylglutaryl-CoA synthase [Aerococcaceae bacterium NML191292]
MKVGIDKIGAYIPKHYVEMTELAKARNIDPNKLTIGIGQDRMTVPTLCEDIVTMAANAALQILDDSDKAAIDQIIFATESSFDFSKAAATYLHELLEIQPYAKAYELKQACYGTTAGVQIAADYVRLRPNRKVLVIASDIARYGLNTPGEATQGAGAIALLISANPRILALDLESVSYTTNQYDFWRPSYSSVAFVDGKFSTELYQDCFKQVMKQANLQDLTALVFHLPFSKMGKKALDAYKEVAPSELASVIEQWEAHYGNSILLGRQVGNIYTGSLYLSLLSLLWHSDELEAGQRIGLFSYGSGAVAELFCGELQSDYKAQIAQMDLATHLNRRVALPIAEYEAIFEQKLPVSDEVIRIDDAYTVDGVHLACIDAHRRYYTK